MAIVRPFKAVRPKAEYAADVAALPYDVMNSDEAREMVRGKPYSFLHVDKAEIDLPEGTGIYSDEVYDKAKENLIRLRADGIFFQDKEPLLYIYRQEMSGRRQTGVAACVSIDDYINNIIKKHEFTRADKEQDRIRHVDICDANTGPIFLTYRGRDSIDKILEKYLLKTPEYDFTAADNTKHSVWLIDAREDIDALVKEFAAVPYLYIADGHHRAASAVNVGQKRREQRLGYTGQEEFNFFLAVLFKSDDLAIMDYNRLIKDLGGHTKDALLEELAKKFDVKKHESGAYAPEERHSFGMYIENEWYRLTARPEIINEADPVARLDVSILQDNVIAPIFGISDPRTDGRIDFVGGIRGLKELERRVSLDMALAFSMYPTSLDELMSIADCGQVMPPKSTWFEPKLLSGLFIHPLK